MKDDEHIIAEAVRIEHSEADDQLFIVFKIIDQKFKQDVKTNWIRDIEYRLINRNLIKE